MSKAFSGSPFSISELASSQAFCKVSDTAIVLGGQLIIQNANGNNPSNK
jgi:hypothetical protein